MGSLPKSTLGVIRCSKLRKNPCFDNLYGSRINGKFSSCSLRQGTYSGPLLRLEHWASGAIISPGNLSWLRTLTSNTKESDQSGQNYTRCSLEARPSSHTGLDSIAMCPNCGRFRPFQSHTAPRRNRREDNHARKRAPFRRTRPKVTFRSLRPLSAELPQRGPRLKVHR
jgi:hypothetical protein